jgi:hypothetical protein
MDPGSWPGAFLPVAAALFYRIAQIIEKCWRSSVFGILRPGIK